MKFLNHLHALLLVLILMGSCVTGVQQESQVLLEMDSVSSDLVETIEMDSVLPETEEMDLEDALTEAEFLKLFPFDFKRKIDFGWRYIQSNSEDYEMDTTLVSTPHNRDNYLDDYAKMKVETGGAKGNIVPIDFLSGYGHSYCKIALRYVFITYQLMEISEEFHYYYLDNSFNLIREGTLAQAGGDEGTWFYSYGNFSQDLSHYKFTFVAGEGMDTMDLDSENIYF